MIIIIIIHRRRHRTIQNLMGRNNNYRVRRRRIKNIKKYIERTQERDEHSSNLKHCQRPSGVPSVLLLYNIQFLSYTL